MRNFLTYLSFPFILLFAFIIEKYEYFFIGVLILSIILIILSL